MSKLFKVFYSDFSKTVLRKSYILKRGCSDKIKEKENYFSKGKCKNKKRRSRGHMPKKRRNRLGRRKKRREKEEKNRRTDRGRKEK